MAKSPELVEALSHMLSLQPFHAVLLVSKMQVIETDMIATKDGIQPNPTAATDGVSLYVNPAWFNALTLKERVFVLAHEVEHYIFQHMPRIKMYEGMGFGPDMKAFNGKKFNQAADYVINAHLTKANIGTMPIGGLINPQISGNDLVDDVYLKLPDPPPDPGGQGGQSGQSNGGQGGASQGQGGNPNNGGGQNFDKHLPAPPNGPSANEVATAVISAANTAKAMGKMPGGFERLINEILAPQKKWQDELRALMLASAGRDEASWAKPHRRRLAMSPGIVMPGYTGFSMGGIVVQIDTSGSISDRELKVFMGELSGIITDCNPEWIKVLWTDSQVAGVDEPNSAADLPLLKAKGGGGTNMHAGIEWIYDQGLEPEMLITFTDGYTPWGNEPDFPCYWAITTDQVAPYGTTIRVEVK